MHNDTKHFAEQEAPTAAEDRLRETHDAGGLLQFLWSRMEGHGWSDRELDWLSCTSDQAELMALNLRKTLAGVATLIAFEADKEGTRSGAFQPHDLPELLYGVADTLGVMEEMIHIGIDADFKLRERYRKRAEKKEGVCDSPVGGTGS
jgi:hypothetical protein